MGRRFLLADRLSDAFASRRKIAVSLVAFVALAGIPAGWSGFARAENCRLERIAALPMVDNDAGSPVVSVLIDDQPREMLLDTGGFWSMLDPSAAARYRVRQPRIEGRLGLGATRLNHVVQVPSVTIGPLKIKRADFYLAPHGYEEFDGTLGANWLETMDVEIDPVENKVSLFSHNHCAGEMVHWPHRDLAVMPVRFERERGWITVPVTLDGKEIRALIDTGSAETILSLRAAERIFGLKPDSLGVEPFGATRGVGARIEPSYRYRFKSLELGGIAFSNPWLTLADNANASPDLILGMHQLHGLHLFFAYGERMLYATSARGDIAERKAVGVAEAAAPGLADPLDRINAHDLLQSAATAIEKQDYAAAAADLDEALRFDAGYPPAFVVRAALDSAHGDRDRALRDLDQAIRIDPKYAGAYMERSYLYQLAGDYERALDDADRAVRLDPKSAAALNNRCWYGAISGHLDAALSDCDAALDLSPSDPTILDSRALVHFKAGRLDKAIADYDSALDEAPTMAPSLYGRGLAKRQKGDLSAGDADIAAARRIDPEVALHFAK